jgi:hypothetical protein
LDRKDSIITEEEDKQHEESHIKGALNQCGYPDWSINKVITDKDLPKQKEKPTQDSKNKGLVVVPYVEGLSERMSRIFKKHGFSTSMKPHCTLRNLLVHPKDKRDPLQTAEAIYEIPCKSCPKTYIGETGRLFSTRLKEHKTEAEKACNKSFTRSQRKQSTSDIYKSAITEHAASNNHVIGWDEAQVIDQESNKTTRWLKEAIWIRSRGTNTMNKDEGAYKLSRIYDQLITKRQPKNLATSSKPDKSVANF